jgi:hypothetical protein
MPKKSPLLEATMPPIDISAIMNQVLEMNNSKYLKVIRDNLHRHESQINHLMKQMHELEGEVADAQGDFHTSAGTVTSPRLDSGHGIAVPLPLGRPPVPVTLPGSPMYVTEQAVPVIQAPAAPIMRKAADRVDIAVQTSPRFAERVGVKSGLDGPISLRQGGKSLVLMVNASYRQTKVPMTPFGQIAQTMIQQIDPEEVDKLRDRLRQTEKAMSALETQFYNLEKAVINDGALRPYSARADLAGLILGGGPSSGRQAARYHGRRSPQDQEPPQPPTTGRYTTTPKAEQPPEQPTATVPIKTAPQPSGPPPTEPQRPPPQPSRPEQPSFQYKPWIGGSAPPEEPKVSNKMARGDALTIDPDFQQSQAIQEQQKPEEISIPRYEEQFRILREAIVELRTNIQILKVKSEQPVILPTPVIEPVVNEVQGSQADEIALRLLRRKVDTVHRDLEGQIQELRRELYEMMARPQERIVEKIVEVRPANYDEPRQLPSKAPEPQPPVRDINVELNIAKARAFLGDFDEDQILKITKLDPLPEIEAIPATRDRAPPIVETPLRPAVERPREEFRRPPPAPSASPRQPTRERPTVLGPLPAPGTAPEQQQAAVQQQPAATRPGGTEWVGREVPQEVSEMTVTAARQRDLILEAVMPYLVELKTDWQLQLDSTMDRLRCLEGTLPTKVDKEFVDAFFRKIRQTLQDTNERVMGVQSALNDRITQDQLDAKLDEVRAEPKFRESTVAGKTTLTCFVCGAKKTMPQGAPIQAPKRGQVFRGRAAVGVSQTPDYESSQLPPLVVQE